ncbi:hypothetical protein A3SI_03670 [Nitritalea halalkaliphila LW7]|uniref:Phosphoribosyl-AMP cyclohydrolase n=1 Tax=Nitritalea halalkaliphila LW7 TaxID=1189621 RepID=I5C954_9BACT|nr:hypothetical protein [Nitritalea halalkaliphila]EIM78356.1 hypothetical protein A3SI_03670 [Nitritalea halalkaliphila LW7]
MVCHAGSLGLMVSCQAPEKESSELTKQQEEVQRIVEELRLQYVEDGASTIITYEEVLAAQHAWCDALVEIGRRYDAGQDYRAYAEQVIDEAYNYQYGKVFFKPTLAYGTNTFRTTKEGALSYFVGGSDKFPEDKGFALAPYVKARFENLGSSREGIQIYGATAITMGNVYVTDKEGNEIMVDKTWVFKKGDDGKLRIIVHKSSLPFNPN